MGFFDFEFKMDDIKKHQPPLQKLNKVIDWEIFRPMLESALLNKSKEKGGRPLFALFLFNNADSSMGRKISQSITLLSFCKGG